MGRPMNHKHLGSSEGTVLVKKQSTDQGGLWQNWLQAADPLGHEPNQWFIQKHHIG